MGLTVQELADIHSLRTRFLAGRSGAERPVLWAHSIELPNPWNWLGTGDLLLTNGLAIPADAAEQVRFIEELNRANLSGITLGEGPHAPTLSAEALQAADDLGFPVLATEYSMPWVVLVRTVADSNVQKGYSRLARIIRAYDLLRRTYSSPELNEQLLASLGAQCGCELHVIERDTGVELLPAEEPLDAPVRSAVLEHIAGDDPLPAFSRVHASPTTSFVLPVAESVRAVLVARQRREEATPDLTVLQHVSTIIGLEVERRAADELRTRAAGTRLLRQILTGTGDPELVATQLADYGLEHPPWCMVRWAARSRVDAGDVDTALTRRHAPHLVCDDRRDTLALVRAGALAALRGALAGMPSVRIGVSQPVHTLSGLADAAREARWALEAGNSLDQQVTVYGEGSSPFLPRSITEGEVAVERILGPVLDYDQANDSDLLRSLIAYFDANRSWQNGAEALGIHRQTLIYRIGRIEKLTGLRIQSIADQTELYLAVQTWKMLNAGTSAVAGSDESGSHRARPLDG